MGARALFGIPELLKSIKVGKIEGFQQFLKVFFDDFCGKSLIMGCKCILDIVDTGENDKNGGKKALEIVRKYPQMIRNA